MSQTLRDDRIFPVTRVTLAVVDAALLLAFLTLYFFPQNTRTNFAWEIKPAIMAVFMGAGYIAGAFMFLYAILGRRWHRITHSFLPVSTFAAAMLLTTLLHFDRFLHQNLAFMIWLAIYLVTPFLIPWLWFHNRVTDLGTFEENDRIVPTWIRWVVGLMGLLTLLYWAVNFIAPSLLIATWPWNLTPLTARTVCAWGMLVSVGGLVLWRDPRWSAWRYPVQAIALWQGLMVIGSILHRQDFKNGSLINGYFLVILLALLGLGLLYAWMELGAPRYEPHPPG